MNQLQIEFQIKLQACESSFKSSFRSKLPYCSPGPLYIYWCSVHAFHSFPPPCNTFGKLLTLPLAAAYRFSQMSELYSMKTQGDVSALMWFLDAYACAGQCSKKAIEASKKPLSIILWLSAQWITCAVSTLNTWLLLRNSEIDGSLEGVNPAYHETQQIKALVILHCNAIPHVYTTVSPMQLASSLLLLKSRICSVRMLTQ